MLRTSLSLSALFLLSMGSAAQKPHSHPPLRTPPPPSNRAMDRGPSYYVDASKGEDRNDGSKEKPWKTVAHAVKQLRAGDTLYLRGGSYHENVYVALMGKKDAPITIRSAPGERAILDGSWREFQENATDAWQVCPGGVAGEYRSKRRFPNLRNVVGSFGDSMIGLQTYYHRIDLQATGELVEWEKPDAIAQSDIKPLWCGPGLWYDPATGHIHVRLAHTHLPAPVPNYRGETDPRKLPLVLAPFTSTPLTLDGAKHVRIQDLVLCGAGYTALILDQAQDIEIDNVTVWCGAYGMRVSGARDLHVLHSGFYGSVAPWTFRGDGSKRDYPGRPHRNISRLNTHAHLEIESGRESSVYATPQNDDWEIAHCEFTDAHDGVYLGSINVKFHHNLIENLQDDGIYLSPMYMRHRLDNRDPEIHVYQNIFRGMLTALAFGGTEATTRDKVFVYRNVFDLSMKVQTGRPTGQKAAASFSTGKVIGDHGSPPWSAMNLYHNTFIMAEASRQADMATLGASKLERPRRVFNNIFLHRERMPGFVGAVPANDVMEDGNLFWSPGADKTATTFFNKYRASPLYAESKKSYPPGSSTHSLVADPKLREGDARLQEGSPAVDAGVMLDESWPDPLRKQDKGKPDIGALPLGAEALKVGRKGSN